MTYRTLYPPTPLNYRRMILDPISTFLKPVSIEFHETLASLGTRLWGMIPRSHQRRDEKAWEKTLVEIKEMIESELPEHNFTSCRWDEKFDRTFITPLRNGKSIQIKKKHNLEHYLEEQANLEHFRARVEQLLSKNLSRIYASNLHPK